MSSKTKQAIYIVLALGGAVSTWYFNLQIEDLSGFFSAMWATPLTSSLSADLTFASLTFFVLMAVETKRVRIPLWSVALCFVLTFLVAFAFAFPLFMLFRERAMESEPKK